LFLAKTTSKTEGKSFHSHEIRFNYTRNTLQTRSRILILLQFSIKIPYSDFKILFKSLKYIQNGLKSVLKYSWFGKGSWTLIQCSTSLLLSPSNSLVQVMLGGGLPVAPHNNCNLDPSGTVWSGLILVRLAGTDKSLHKVKGTLLLHVSNFKTKRCLILHAQSGHG